MELPSLLELVGLLDARFGDLGIDSLVLRSVPAGASISLDDLFDGDPPQSFVDVVTSVCLAGVDIGISYGPGETTDDYLGWVVDRSKQVQSSAPTSSDGVMSFVARSYVAECDAFYCLLGSDDIVWAVPRGEDPTAGFSLSCDFAELLLGAGTVLLARKTEEEELVRRAVAEEIGSPARFWDAI